MPRRTPKQILEFLCDGLDDFWQWVDGRKVVNIYRLRKALEDKYGETRKLPSQSTLARAYAETTDAFSDETLDTLSDFFDVPGAVARGDVELNTLEAWGMDITIAELRLLSIMRKLSPEQRTAIHRMLQTFFPGDPPLIAPIPPPNVTAFPTNRIPSKR